MPSIKVLVAIIRYSFVFFWQYSAKICSLTVLVEPPVNMSIKQSYSMLGTPGGSVMLDPRGFHINVQMFAHTCSVVHKRTVFGISVCNILSSLAKSL